MAVTLTLDGKTPGQTQFGLDMFTEHYKTNTTADEVLTDPGVPQKGDAHPDYPFMFLTDRHVQETGERASALDLVYMGALKDDGGGNPILPPSRQKYSNAIQTATSQFPLVGVPATPPLTLQFYAATSEYVFFSYNAPGVLDTAPEPIEDPKIISLTGNLSYSPMSTTIDQIILNFFQLRVTDLITPQEIVSGKFWQNTEVKTLFYGTPIFVVQVFSGTKVVALFNPGRNYAISDSLTLTDGANSATLTVASVGARDSITDFTVSADTITSATFKVIAATGGSGTGATFVCVDLP